ncbi:MAG: hypothetical protein Q7U48_13750 [Hydrogenophaga sp.]|nr:hypothetical protein [Hydrogenophaga sp.]
MARKLTATHDGETFTRTTNRAYSHIVVVRPSLDKTLARAARNAPISQRDFSRLVEVANNTYELMQYVNEAQIEEAKFAIQMGYADYNQHLVSKAVVRASTNFDPHWYVAGWCGRLDLAQKLSAKETTSEWSVAAEVAIVPVNP